MKRPWLFGGLALAAPLLLYGFSQWRAAGNRGGQSAAEPFRIAGNLYYVGASDTTSYLITGPEGHVLIDGGFPGTPPLIMGAIAKLGFDIRDVKVLLNSEPNLDHAGGLAELQKVSGARLWVSEEGARAISSGGVSQGTSTPITMIRWLGLGSYAPARVDKRVKDGEVVRLGPIELTAHITGGHVPGCTSWAIPVQDAGRNLLALNVCNLSVFPGMSLVEPEVYPGIRADFEHSFRVLRSLPVDIWMTTHARAWGRYRKFVESGKSKDPVAPFLDRAGYLAYLDDAEKEFRAKLAEQQGRR